jgi:S-disulfanyl-L-cysteine oxidoreductase SoxD
MDRRSLGKLAVAVAVAASAAVVVFVVLGRSSGPLLEPDDTRAVARGRTVYLENCASCHGRNLEGQPDWKSPDEEGLLPAPPHDGSGHTWHHPDRVLFDVTKLGVAKAANLKDYKTRMPAFEGILGDDEIIAVLSYIKSTWPEDMRLRHDQLNIADKGHARTAP